VLIPIGHARLDDRDDHVMVDRLSADEFRTLPPYAGRLDRQYEDSIRSRFSSTGAGTTGTTHSTGEPGSTGDSDYYTGEPFDDERFYGSRRGTGEGLRPRSTRNREAPGDRGSLGGSEEFRAGTGELGNQPGSSFDRELDNEFGTDAATGRTGDVRDLDNHRDRDI
jgi:hypothetical protein